MAIENYENVILEMNELINHSSCTYETAASKLNPIIEDMGSPNPDITSLEAKYRETAKFLDKVLKRTFPFTDQNTQPELRKLFSKSDPALDAITAIENFTHLAVSTLLKDSENQIDSLFNQAKDNPLSIPTLKNNLVVFKKVLLFLDTLHRCKKYNGTLFLKEFNRHLLTLKDTKLITNLVIKYNLGTKEFDIEKFKIDNPNYDLFKLGAIKSLDDRFKTALSHKELDEVLLQPLTSTK